MKKNELVGMIKLAYQKIKQETDTDLDSNLAPNINIQSEKFPMLSGHIELKKWLKEIFVNQHEIFIRDIEWVSPNPLTFRIVLVNDEMFYMIRKGRTWIAKIEGKKYYLINTSEFEIACQAITRLLEYASTLKKDIKDDESNNSEEQTDEEPIEEPTGE